MKKYFYLIFSFFLLFCTKKNINSTFLPKKNTENIETKNFSVAFSRFSEDYYFWSEKENFENASLFFVDLQDKTGKKLSGKYKISYGIFDEFLEDAIIPSTLTTENLSFFDGSASFSIDLEDLLTRAKLQNKEGWFWFEFIFYDKNNFEVAKIKIGTLIKQKREFKLDIIDVYSYEDSADQITIEVDISDPLFQLPPKTLTPNFYVKFNDLPPKLYNFKADYTENKAYLTLSKNEIPNLTADLRILVWHQVGDLSVVSRVYVKLPNLYINANCKTTENVLLTQTPFNLANVVKNGQNKTIIMNLTGRGLTQVPQTLRCFRELIELYLSENQLTEIPSVISDLKKLQIFGIHQNKIKNIPEDLDLSSLKIFGIAANQLTTLPQSAIQWKNMQKIYLNNNFFEEFPTVLLRLTSLQLLELHYNPLKNLPSDIYKLVNLYHLNLHGHLFTTLPETLKNMQQLKFLDVYGDNLVISHQTFVLTSTNYSVPKCPAGSLLVNLTGSGICRDNFGKACTIKATCAYTWGTVLKGWLPNTQIITKNTL